MLSAWGGRARFAAAVVLVGTFAAIAIAQRTPRGSAQYIYEMQDVIADPPDAARKGEFHIGRLRYRSPLDRRGFGRYLRWGIDANKGDRLFSSILRRLTRVDSESIETVIDISSEELFDHPFLLAISAGDWSLTDDEAKRLAEYLHRGGFLMVDDFHNDGEWADFMRGIHQGDPDAQAVELPDNAAAFHVVFDLKERIRVVGANVVHGSQIERGGTIPHWRGIFDDKERMTVAISFNQDMGDAWEFADDPTYPERMATEGMRLGINYVVYALTH
jgi:hypothetical protein